MALEFSKYQGLGNDFVLLYEQEITPHEAVKICDRHFGVGADGIIQIGHSDRADFSFLLYNADGGVAEVSGNGLRCVGKFLYDRGHHQQTTLKIEAGGQIKVLELNVEDGEVSSVRADMGMPEHQEDIELYGRVWKRIVTGNPHAVTFVEDIATAPVEELGPLVESDPSFPNRTNVEFVQTQGEILHARFWERGVGMTMSSGTGSCACLAASGLPRATVRTLGGDLVVESSRGSLFMTGPAVHVFDGVLNRNLD